MAMVLCVMRRWNDEWETTTKTHGQRTSPKECWCELIRLSLLYWSMVEQRKEEPQWVCFLIHFLVVHIIQCFFPFWYLVCLFRFSHWTLEWRKKSQVLLWFVFSIELPCTTDEQYVISLTMMTGKKKTQTNIQNINQQPKTSSHQHYCGTLSECACIGLLALMASLSKLIQCESERKCAICANKWPVVDRPMWNK